MKKRIVLVVTPEEDDFAWDPRFTVACLNHSLKRNESPTFCPKGTPGIDKIAFYVNNGITDDMRKSMLDAYQKGYSISMRSLDPPWRQTELSTIVATMCIEEGEELEISTFNHH